MLSKNSSVKDISSSLRFIARSFALKANPDKKKKYSHTVKLPKTLFPHWMSSSKRVELDEYIIKQCGFNDLYSWQRKHLNGPEFVLHDGPPYANGLPHLGHAINKILKDIINRSKIISGTKVDFKLGWDCHGLPIELKALRGRIGVEAIGIRNEARIFASKAIDDQKALFRSWGLMADWNNCYYTYDPNYIKNQINQFYNLHEKKLVYRDMKPVYWSPSSRTALAEAELEYNTDHESEAVTVGLPVVDGSSAIYEKHLSLLIWTTTPWSLPANEAVAFNPTFDYSVVEFKSRHYIICSKLIKSLQDKIKVEIKTIKTFKGELLSNMKYEHPLRDEIKPVLPADFVSDDVGTGLVHTAPSHGPDDYQLALRYNIPVISYVDELGRFTKETGEKLSGLPAMETGMAVVLKLIKDVVYRETIKHSYPYDWRTKKPIMIRASKQWFINTKELKDRAVEVLKEVKVMPERNVAGLLAQIENRPYWCISRQRAWGVPIPVLFDQDENVIISKDLIKHFCDLIDKEGTNFWWSRASTELLPPGMIQNSDINCENMKKSEDILDIWFDSGMSWSSVLNGKVADLYLEGIDQFTGWFQSSLLTSVALSDRAPYKAILAHGFAVDSNGRKMSKSLGNVINPQDITHGISGTESRALGIDVLRWWVAGHSLQHTNIPVSQTTLEDSLISIKKIRNTVKYLLGSIHDLPVGTNPTLRLIDEYILIKLAELNKKVADLYDIYEFSKICLVVLNFVTNDISSLYCTVTKDRLYCDDGDRRRAVQLTMNELLHGLLSAIAPIVPVMAEEVFSHHPHYKGKRSYFQSNMGMNRTACNREDYVVSVISVALNVREKVMKGKPLNVDISKLSCTITAGEECWKHLNTLQLNETSNDSELVELLQLSQITLLKSNVPSDLDVKLCANKYHLCERCWKHTAMSPAALCNRCSEVVKNV